MQNRKTRPRKTKQNTLSTFGPKIGAAVGSISALYMLPAVAQAGTVTLPWNYSSTPTFATFSIDGAPILTFGSIGNSSVSGGFAEAVARVGSHSAAPFGVYFQVNSATHLAPVAAGALISTFSPLNSVSGAPLHFANHIVGLGSTYQFVGVHSVFKGSAFTYALPPLQVGDNFVAFAFLNPSTDIYDFGWADLKINSAGVGIASCAWAPDFSSIDAGQTAPGGGSCSVPEPSPLALLALGAGGVVAFRRRRQQEGAAALA